MAGKILIAPDYESVAGKLIFLAGPIQGAEDWQKKAISLITDGNESISIASPRGGYEYRKFDYDTQVNWETFYLNRAAQEGLILFWLAKEKEHSCDRSYAQTTRYELAEWLTKHQQNPDIKLAIGIEPGFTGERYIRKRIGEDCPELRIESTLEAVCKSAAGNY